MLSSYLADRIEANERIIVRTETELAEARGHGRLDNLVPRDRRNGETETVKAAALYILIGTMPCSRWIADRVALDELGFVRTGSQVRARPDRAPTPWPLDRDPLLTETSAPGVFAAGGVRAGTVKRVGSAVGQGSVASSAINQYLRDEVPAELGTG